MSEIERLSAFKLISKPENIFGSPDKRTSDGSEMPVIKEMYPANVALVIQAVAKEFQKFQDIDVRLIPAGEPYDSLHSDVLVPEGQNFVRIEGLGYDRLDSFWNLLNLELQAEIEQRNTKPGDVLKSLMAKLRRKKEGAKPIHEEDPQTLKRMKRIIDGVKENLEHYSPDLRRRLSEIPENDPLWKEIAETGLRIGLEEEESFLWDILLSSSLRKILNLPLELPLSLLRDEKTGRDTFGSLIIGGDRKHAEFTFPENWQKNYRGEFEFVPTNEALNFFDSHGFQRRIWQQAISDATNHRDVFYVTAGLMVNVKDADKVTVRQLKKEDFKEFEMIEPHGVFFMR